jgi:YfiH family protein
VDAFRWKQRDDLRWLEVELPGAKAAFSTRLGGVSAAPFDSLNLGSAVGDSPDSVAENRGQLAGAFGIDPARIGFGAQVHGSDLVEVERSSGAWLRPDQPPGVQADGQIARRPGEAGLVYVADCVPIVVAGRSGIAALHGGWRGLAAGIVGRGVEAVEGAAAAIGPAIGPCCYEVGDDVLAAFRGLGAGRSNDRRIDLPAVAETLLRRAGVDDVARIDLCTRCNPELLFSHRGAGPRTGRQAGVGWMTAEDSGG